MKVVGDEISPAQHVAFYVFVLAITIWTIILGFWLYQHTGLRGNTAMVVIDAIIAVVFLVLAVVNGSSYSIISWWFNEILDRGAGLPWVSIVASVVMTAAIVVSFSRFSNPWVFVITVVICGGLGVPFCSNIMHRYD